VRGAAEGRRQDGRTKSFGMAGQRGWRPRSPGPVGKGEGNLRGLFQQQEGRTRRSMPGGRVRRLLSAVLCVDGGGRWQGKGRRGGRQTFEPCRVEKNQASLRGYIGRPAAEHRGASPGQPDFARQAARPLSLARSLTIRLRHLLFLRSCRPDSARNLETGSCCPLPCLLMATPRNNLQDQLRRLKSSSTAATGASTTGPPRVSQLRAPSSTAAASTSGSSRNASLDAFLKTGSIGGSKAPSGSSAVASTSRGGSTRASLSRAPPASSLWRPSRSSV
jgi:hypothetical protein